MTPNLNQSSTSLLSSFGCYRLSSIISLQSGRQNSNFHHLVPLQLLLNFAYQLRSQAVFANPDGWILVFQYVPNMALHSGGYFAQVPFAPFSCPTVYEFGFRILNMLLRYAASFSVLS